ncbi:MFS general substrate transporter [Setomelanomma holmii]|uniref:MFS general substrate transporter n=1 Tax=Setomelanomma holmii TaxID=210430 RepID=A0A9P4HIX8_9PLEO|nr:MFS general substrate transporter [Setomelanomma holmii]
MARGGAAAAAFDAALQRRQALMGASGTRALYKNFNVLRIALFTCPGGVLYGHNQGMFSAIAGGHNEILANHFITGISVGSLSVIVPMYNSECAPPPNQVTAREVRGALVALQQLAITFGMMISFWINYGTNHIGGTTLETQSNAAWLVPICLQLNPAFEEARKTLAHLRDLPEDYELIELEFLEIKAQSLFEKRTWNIFKLQFVAIEALFKTKAMFKRVIVTTVTMFFQQWSGINAVLYYAPQIFVQLGLTGNTTLLLATGVVGIVIFLATIPAVLCIDRVGRKPVFAIGMGFSHLVIAIILAKNINRFAEGKAADWAAVVMVWLFVIHFGYSWVWHLHPFWTSIILGAAFIWFFVPETKHLTLEEMDTIFGADSTSEKDLERMREINHEIELAALAGDARHSDDGVIVGSEKGAVDV